MENNWEAEFDRIAPEHTQLQKSFIYSLIEKAKEDEHTRICQIVKDEKKPCEWDVMDDYWNRALEAVLEEINLKHL